MSVDQKVQFGSQLKFFSLHGKNLPDFEVENLTSLTIYEADSVSEECLLAFLKKSPHLILLKIYGCEGITDRTLESIKHYPLEQVWLYGPSQITDRGRGHYPVLERHY